jgi:hypothetical protein
MKQHGNYNHDNKLPDNRMQPNESGLNVWLQEQIIARLGNDQAQDLIQQATSHKEKRYAWMLDRMKERGHPDLAEEYHQRHLAHEAQRRYAAKERELSRWQDRLSEANDPQHKVPTWANLG